MEYIQELIKKELSKIKDESEIFSSYKKSRNSLIKKITDNDDEKNWYKRARNYFSIYSTIKSLRILNETEGSFIKSFDSLLDDSERISNDHVKKYFQNQLYSLKNKIIIRSNIIVGFNQLNNLCIKIHDNKLVRMGKNLTDYCNLVEKISKLIEKFEDPVTKLRGIQRRNYIYKLNRKLDFLNAQNCEQFSKQVSNIENHANESIKIEKENLDAALIKIGIMDKELTTIIESNDGYLDNSQINNLDRLRNELLTKRSHAFETDYVMNDILIIESQLHSLSCEINMIKSRKILLIQSSNWMIDTLDQAGNYIESSKKYITKIDNLNKSHYIKLNNKSLDSAVNSLINHKNDLIKDVENLYI